jgi:Zn-dependent M28 family amino/carboxypeptidase
MKNLWLAFSATVILLSCGEKSNTAPEEGLDSFNKDSFALAVKEMSSDAYMGRKPFTPGETKTIEFIQMKFAGLGLEPGNNGSWFQDVPMVNIRATADSIMNVQTPKGGMTLKAFDSYVIWTDKTDASQNLTNTDVIFAGYGVVAPEYNWNDYAGLDVKGKIVIVLVNDPGFNAGDSTLFKGKTMTYYGRWTYKFEEAAKQGAKGCLIVHETKAAGYPFSVQQANFNTARLQLDPRGNKAQEHCDIIGWLPDSTAKRLISISGMNADSLIASADKKGFRPQALPLQFTTGLKVQTDYNVTKNVIGKINGSKYPDETIIYTAHWDHLGIGKPDESGDSIYNGAFDNATGVAGLFEIAKGFKSLKTPPERTVVFLAVTAEEQGLWGSAYYAANPIFPLEKTVANINMDGVNYLGRAKDVISIGKGLSELEDLLAEAAKKQGRYMADEGHPEAGYYYRSDHFNFAKGGVPSLHFDDGTDMEMIKREDVEKQKEEYRLKHYHRPSDEFNDQWDLSGAIEDFQLYFLLGKKLAYGRTWPKWKEGAEFKGLREKSDGMRK